MLRESASVFCEFLEVATHTLLYSRGVYPAEIFERRRYELNSCSIMAFILNLLAENTIYQFVKADTKS